MGLLLGDTDTLGAVPGLLDDLGEALTEAFGVARGVAFDDVFGDADAEADGDCISDAEGCGLTKITLILSLSADSGNGDTRFPRDTNKKAINPKISKTAKVIPKTVTKSFFLFEPVELILGASFSMS